MDHRRTIPLEDLLQNASRLHGYAKNMNAWSLHISLEFYPFYLQVVLYAILHSFRTHQYPTCSSKQLSFPPAPTQTTSFPYPPAIAPSFSQLPHKSTHDPTPTKLSTPDKRYEGDSLLGQVLPPEVIRMIVLWLVVFYHNPPRSRESSAPKLKVLSLVCRDWRRLFLPHIFEHLRFTEDLGGGENISKFLSALPKSDNMFASTTKLSLERISIQHLQPNTLTKLGRSLPKLTHLVIKEVDWSEATCSHPRWTRLFAASWRSFPSVEKLEIAHCQFPSSLNVLSMLGNLPALLLAKVSDVQWNRTSIPWAKHINLYQLDIVNTDIWPFLHLLVLPRRNCLSRGSYYQGCAHWKVKEVSSAPPSIPWRTGNVRLWRFPHTCT